MVYFIASNTILRLHITVLHKNVFFLIHPNWYKIQIYIGYYFLTFGKLRTISF